MRVVRPGKRGGGAAVVGRSGGSRSKRETMLLGLAIAGSLVFALGAMLQHRALSSLERFAVEANHPPMITVDAKDEAGRVAFRSTEVEVEAARATDDSPDDGGGAALQVWNGTGWSGTVVWRLPTPRTAAAAARGVALLLHACSHDATKFFVASPGCPDCVGLSEEVLVADAFLGEGFAVAALTSRDRRTGCWSGEDEAAAVGVLEAAEDMVRSRRGSRSTPWTRIAFGASSGGAFVEQFFASRRRLPRLSGGALVDGVLSQVPPAGSHPRDVGIPVAITTMPRDGRTAAFASAAVARWGPSLSRHDSCGPLNVTASMLASRVPRLGRKRAGDIVGALERAGHIDEYGTLLRDPTRSDWRDAIAELGDLGLELNAGRSPLTKALHRAWAFHEYCSDVVVEQIRWVMDFERRKKVGKDRP